MSDDDKNETPDANQGATLPNVEIASHNIKLVPLFLAGYGNGYGWDNGLAYATVGRGTIGWFWSTTVFSIISSYDLNHNGSGVLPSSGNGRHFAFSLRCLVSTTNS